MTRTRFRLAAALLLAALLLPGLFLRDRGKRWDNNGRIAVRALTVAESARRHLGPFRLAGAWQLSSRDALFGGYSALVARPGGRLLALSDRGGRLELREPPAGPAPYRLARISPDPVDWSGINDAEAATTGPSGEVWVSWEDRKALSRMSPDFTREDRVMPAEMRNWDSQFGAESLARLGDGRFLIVSEAFIPRSYERLHETLVYPSDPTLGAARVNNGPATVPARRGRLKVSGGYRPTDIAVLPDGRVLVLLRQLIWPLPLRFSCRIAIADPAELDRTGRWVARDLAWLDPPLPSDNYEGLAVRPRADGRIDVWVISDDNRASTQRTLLLKLLLDPKDLPSRPDNVAL